MRVALVVLGISIFGSFAQAVELDSLAFLKRDLGKEIEVISPQELRYCPDNTCAIYRIKDPLMAVHLSQFVYLHLFHKSDYIYLKEGRGESRPFRQLAKDTEPLVRKQVENFCSGAVKTPTCIITGMKKALGVSIKVGRYDEGKFIES